MSIEVSYKNDVFIKYALGGNDAISCMLRNFIIASLTDLHPVYTEVLNGEMMPNVLNGKKVILDILCRDDLINLIDIEMQLSGFTKREYMRFQDYGFRMAESKLHRGDDYENMKKCYQIVFMDAYPSDSKSFIRTFQKRDGDNVLLKHNLISLTFVHLPMINDIVKEKGIENLTSFEKLCYVFKNGPDDAILKEKERMERMVEAIMQKYEEMRSNAPIWSWASAVERGEQAYYNVIQDKYEEGVEEGMVSLLSRLLYKNTISMRLTGYPL